jgi:hypothetical protein
MAEWIVPLLATQVACVRFMVPARLTFRVENGALFCNPTSGGTFSSPYKMGSNFCSSASKGVPHLEAWVHSGRGILHVKGHNSALRLVIPNNKDYFIDKKKYNFFSRSNFTQR